MNSGETLSGQKLVVTIIPHYNQHEFLFEAVKSCINQTYTKHTTCVIDDFSTNPGLVTEQVFTKQGLTPEWVESHDEYTYVWHPKVCLLMSKERGGPAKARNLGIKHHMQLADAFMFLDADDYVKASKVEDFVKAMEKDWDKVGVVYSDYFIKKQYDRINHEYKEPYSLKGVTERSIIPGNGLVNKFVFESVGLFDESAKMTEDHEFWRRMSKYRPHFQCVHLPEAYTTVRERTNNPTNANAVPGNVWRHCVES